MARSLTPPQPRASSRREQVRLGIGIEVITIVWMVMEAAVALTTGFTTTRATITHHTAPTANCIGNHFLTSTQRD